MEVDLAKNSIEAAKEVGVAFGENQPDIEYQVEDWY